MFWKGICETLVKRNLILIFPVSNAPETLTKHSATALRIEQEKAGLALPSFNTKKEKKGINFGHAS